MYAAEVQEANARPPALVISLDFELQWGIHEHFRRNGVEVTDRLHGARGAVERMLEVFETRGIHATWAAVGKLFADGADELDRFSPRRRPGYARREADTYQEDTGRNEAEDPLHFAPTLIRRIDGTPGQEVASHTFAHYYCGEPGQTTDDFRSDLAAARQIASAKGISIRSLVLPRNQVLEEYVRLLPDEGIVAYRGNPPRGMYHLPRSELFRSLVRVIRYLDTYVNLTGTHVTPWEGIGSEAPFNVCASLFLRPYSGIGGPLETLRRRRIRTALRAAARKGGICHLWWHPHNFGVDTETNLAALAEVLDEFERLRDQYGMVSLNMGEVADRAGDGGAGAGSGGL